MFLLTTDRLHLRPFQEADLAAFAAYRSDPAVARYQSWTPPYSIQQARAFFAVLQQTQPGQPGKWYQAAVERRAAPGIIGDCGFEVLAEDGQQAQIGFTFAQQYQHQGYAAEAVTCLLAYLFGTLRMHRVRAICDVDNPGSYRLLERVGMRREAHWIENIWFKGAWGSEYQYAVLAREWAVLHPAPPDAP